MEALVYIANCLYLTSYLVKDMLRLRLLTLVAAICLMTYFYARPEPMLTVVCWNLVFIALNVVQVVRLVAEERLLHSRATPHHGVNCRGTAVQCSRKATVAVRT